MNKKTAKRMVFNALIFAVLIIATFWFVFKDQDIGQIFDVAKSANPWFLLLGVFFMLMYFAMEAINIKSILKSFGEKLSFWKSYKFTMIGFFFAAITPSATGGQPLEVYYMAKEKIPAAHGALALLVQVCGIQISTMLLGTISMVLNTNLLTGPVLWLSIFGFVINGIALAALLVCIFNNKLTRNLVNGFMSFLKHIGFKKIENKREKVGQSLDQYAEGAKYMKTHKKEFLMAIFRVFIQFCFYFSVPYCIYRAFGLEGMSFFEIFALQAILFMATSALPLPGAIGASESVFLNLFGLAFGAELLPSAMLLNRGVTFYLFVLVTLFVVFFNIVRIKNTKK
ncbi:flippase-like domain-containing protein [Candidatus Saccharibacteria bacterium]|nr:flippase-like domain-containing protein [Candidatus Saccharibacteria bacterium]